MNNFFENPEGIWLCQKTIYNFRKSCAFDYKGSIDVYTDDDKNINKPLKKQYKLPYNSSNINLIINYINKELLEGEINTISILENIDMTFNISKNYTKIISIRKNFNYIEYFYDINSNIKLSLLVMKKYNHLIAYSFTSYVKIAKLTINPL
uniref:Uncharacterized protein n=1 Tax=Spyridia filamentosa TaxID=196632 RepID=A0A1Z1MJD7_SPYFI|nr:hypothetical protein [Spyridia filamentosa]ARW66190.1 hypothetical protein [Spyridia filamentosa]